MLRSWAGVSSLSKMTSESSDSSQAAFSVSSLPEPMRVAGSGRSRSWVNRSTGVDVGGLGEPGEFLERVLDVRPAHGARDETDERRTFAPLRAAALSREIRHRRHVSTSVTGRSPRPRR